MPMGSLQPLATLYLLGMLVASCLGHHHHHHSGGLVPRGSNLQQKELSLMNNIITTLNTLLTTTTVDLPIKLTNFGKSIVDQVTMMVRQCNAVCRGPGDKPTQNIQLFNGRYAIINNSTAYPSRNSISELKVPRDFVPSPGTFHGCSRFPSYSNHYGLWCYSHTVSNDTCDGSNPSVQILSVGKLITGDNGQPEHKTLYTQQLSQTDRLYHCSVTMTTLGCYILCSKPRVNETQDYETIGIEPMIIGMLGLDGVYTDLGNPVGISDNSLYAMYPGPGGGVMYKDFLVFPLHGGVRFSEASKMLGKNITFRGFPPSDTCTEHEKSLTQEPANMLTSPYYGEVLVLDFLYVCTLLDNIPGECSIQLIPPDNMTMGSESKLYKLNNSLLLYKRSSSWWPYTEVYQLSLRVSKNSMKVRESVRLNITSTTRPGVEGCNINKVCPKVCVTGVFQAPGIIRKALSPKESNEDLLFFQAWTSDSIARQGPLISLCRADSCVLTIPLGNSDVFIGYTDSFCLSDRDNEKIYCVALLELDNMPYSEMTIRSFLYLIK
nr:SOSV_HN-ecto [synthetic construct]